ncbi:MAG TPA: TA system VapC family ribonuclease toxin [Candidatus Acidoferrum sp.]|nr:TA system VapC family ribonuclease toxin [Candidatus Acidoferrum sp.]
MRFLLDVNVLVAICVVQHEFHERVATWMNQSARSGKAELITCAVTELGFLRVLAQAPSYSFTVEHGIELLSRLKSSKEYRFGFLPDELGIDQLPRWVKGPKQITDGHLAELAKTHGATLATLDEGIPSAMIIGAKG